MCLENKRFGSGSGRNLVCQLQKTKKDVTWPEKKTVIIVWWTKKNKTKITRFVNKKF